MSRQEEIKAAFLKLVDQHMDDLRHGRIERRHSTSDFARLLFIHPRHLTDTIKLATGKSPCDIMEERFMAEAHRMLSETTLSIADIGGRLGWNDPSNFTKFFRHMSGITPMQFRKNAAAVRV